MAAGPMEEHSVTSIIMRAGATSAAAFVVAAAFCLAPDGARAQLNPEELLKQVLPGATQGTTENAAAGEFACQRYAEDQGLEVRRVIDSRPSGRNDLEVTLSIDDRDGRYDARCIYDNGDREVRELRPIQTAASRSSRSRDEVSDGVARRARQACAEMARDRDLSAVDMQDPEARGAEVVEIEMRAMVDGDRRDLTCLYDDDQRRALLAE